VLVDFRKVIYKGKEVIYTKKGFSITFESWKKLKQLVPVIDKEINKICGSSRLGVGSPKLKTACKSLDLQNNKEDEQDI
jgi:hypothetical protein